MGWSIHLTSNQHIKRDEITEIVEALPAPLRGPWEGMGIPMVTQNAGWHTACDIYEPKENILIIGGSYGMSGKIAEQMAEHLKHELERNGHTIHIEPHW